MATLIAWATVLKLLASSVKEDPVSLKSVLIHCTGANPGNQFNMTGVAYEATIEAYRAFGCQGGVSDDVLVQAIMTAWVHSNDVITISLASPAGWTESFSSVISSDVAEIGRIVIIAAGNNTASGAFYTSGPSSGIAVIPVASVNNTVTPIQNAISSDGDAPIPYFSFMPLNFTESLPVYAVSDACNPLPAPLRPCDSVVPISFGNCTFVTELVSVAQKGARVALFYNNGSPLGCNQ
jgi:hypothetical protein